jgi:hypothetical protein
VYEAQGPIQRGVAELRLLARIIQCAVKLCFISGSQSRPATIVLAGSNRSGSGGNKTARAFGGKGRFWRLRESVGRNVSER